jgi:hypothetical protein
MLGFFAALPDWLKKWAIGFILGKIVRWVNDTFSTMAAREVEVREKKQEEIDARPPDADSVDSRLDGGSA